MKLYRSINEDTREFQGMDHRWSGEDRGLIWCWERGRQMAESDPELSVRAKSGELMVLGWRGGVDAGLKMEKKIGTLQYLAQWQGLANNDLEIETDEAVSKVCSLADIEVTFQASTQPVAQTS
jgi:hypothetical protein